MHKWAAAPTWAPIVVLVEKPVMDTVSTVTPIATVAVEHIVVGANVMIS